MQIDKILKYILTLAGLIADRPIFVVISGSVKGSSVSRIGHAVCLALANGLSSFTQSALPVMVYSDTLAPLPSDFSPLDLQKPTIFFINSELAAEYAAGIPRGVTVKIRLTWFPSWLVAVGSFLRKHLGITIGSNTFTLTRNQLLDSGITN